MRRLLAILMLWPTLLLAQQQTLLGAGLQGFGGGTSTNVTYIKKVDWSAGISPFSLNCGDGLFAQIATTTRSGGSITVDTGGVASGYSSTQTVSLYGTTDAAINSNSYTITSTPTTHSYIVSGAPAGTANGTGGTSVVAGNGCVADGLGRCAYDASVSFGTTGSLKCPITWIAANSAGAAQNPNGIVCTTGVDCGGGTPYNPAVSVSPAFYIMFGYTVDQTYLNGNANQGGGSPANLLQLKLALCRRANGGAGYCQTLFQNQDTSVVNVADDGGGASVFVNANTIATQWTRVIYKITRSGGVGCTVLWRDTGNVSGSPVWTQGAQFTTASPYCAASQGWDGTSNTDGMQINIAGAVIQTIVGAIAAGGVGNVWIGPVCVTNFFPTNGTC